ncbi:putative phosphatase, C-terminal domain of histone macro H2A1 like protein [Lachnospiraceae bacterium JC7]|nr:putative phosphatase, C-terminal domain of histone macro H2A1 like protein [Lachnospiraceae bacterium JC7]
MSTVTIQKISITDLTTDVIVNAANEGLWPGGGVCGAIFQAAGYHELEAVCEAIGHCDTGSAVITPGFHLKSRYIIHAVGPRYADGLHHEPELLYSAYSRSLELAMKEGLHSIGFPLISAGIFGYPLSPAWQIALQACRDFITVNKDYDINIVFAVLDDRILQRGHEILEETGI